MPRTRRVAGLRSFRQAAEATMKRRFVIGLAAMLSGCMPTGVSVTV